jgi:hypothetical protein
VLLRLKKPKIALSLIVGISILVHGIIAFFRTTPVLFPDEYIYAALGRSLSHSGTFSIRGASAHFPAILQPLMTSPLWLLPHVSESYRAIQILNVIVMSSSAIPVYLLGNHLLKIRSSYSLTAAAFSVLIPEVVYSGWILSEPFAYPLFLWAVWAAVRSFEKQGLKGQLLFLSIAFLATIARVQFIILLPAYIITVGIVVGLANGRLKKLKNYSLIPLLFVAGTLGILAIGVSTALGFYKGITDFHYSLKFLASWFSRDAAELTYVAGWTIIPGAIIFLIRSFSKKSSATVISFSSMVVISLIGLLVESAYYSGDQRIQERYFFYIIPLLFLCFARYAEEGWPWKRLHSLMVVSLIGISLFVSLDKFMEGHMKDDSPFLLGVSWLTQQLTIPITAVIPIFLCLSGLALVVIISKRPERAFWTAVLPAMILISFASLSFALFDTTNTLHQRKINQSISYVDDSHQGSTTLLAIPGSRRLIAAWMLFWNGDLKHIAVTPGAANPDPFVSTGLKFSKFGNLVSEKTKSPLIGPLMIDYNSTIFDIRGGAQKTVGDYLHLWRGKEVKVKMMAINFYATGWVGPYAEIYLWPNDSGHKLNGHLMINFSLPAQQSINGKLGIAVKNTGWGKTITVNPGEERMVSIPVCSSEKWRAKVTGLGPFKGATAFSDGQLLLVRYTHPKFINDGTGCQDLPSPNAKTALSHPSSGHP